MTSTTTRLAAGLAALATVAVLPACGTATKEDVGARGSSAPASAQVAVHNADDVMFAQLMIPHHQQAIELSALVPERSTNPDVVALAATIAAGQQPEIDTMRALLVQWDVNPDGMSHPGGHAGMPMQGMVDAATLNRLESLNGPGFDRLWLQLMIDHHQGAIVMSTPEVGNGENPDMTVLARTIIDTQQAEINEMKQILAGVVG